MRKFITFSCLLLCIATNFVQIAHGQNIELQSQEPQSQEQHNLDQHISGAQELRGQKPYLLAQNSELASVNTKSEPKPDVQAQAADPNDETDSAIDRSSQNVSHTETDQSQTIYEAAQADTAQTDDDIAAKLKAADAAQKEAYDALRRKFESGALNDEGLEGDVNSEVKTSLIPKDMDSLKAQAKKIFGKIFGWLKTPSFLAQVGAIFIIWALLSSLLEKQLRSRVFFLRDPPAEGQKFLAIRQYVYNALNLLKPILNVILLSLAAVILKAAMGQDWLVKLAQSLAVVFLIYSAIRHFASNALIQKIGLWVLIPLALLVVFGYFDDLLSVLDSMALGSGERPISVLTIIKLVLFGSVLFYLGNFSNKKSQAAIRSQEALDVGIREIIAKILQIVIFGAAALMAMSAAGIGLSGLVVVFSALSLGIGLGLQPVAANFVSGMIILFDRSVRVGDYVLLDDGQEGFVEAINMRSTTVETTDGKDIMVPNTTFIENSYENWTHKDPRQRYEVYFSVGYDTDIDKLEEIIIPVFKAHPSVLDDPEKPDLELREFGPNGINFAVEFWCSGIDDGPNKFTSDLNFAVWRVLRDHNIHMPLPQREVRMLK